MPRWLRRLVARGRLGLHSIQVQFTYVSFKEQLLVCTSVYSVVSPEHFHVHRLMELDPLPALVPADRLPPRAASPGQQTVQCWY